MSELLHVVCPHCDAVNRIPQERLEARPKCGQCGEPLFLGEPLALTGANFVKHLARHDIPVLVDFWAPWCGPCKMMAPQYQQAAIQLEPHFRVAKVDSEAEQGLAGQYGIRSIPTLVLFRGGREVARQPGAMDADDIIRWAQGH